MKYIVKVVATSVAILTYLVPFAIAQQDITLKGMVLDGKTQKPVEYASVALFTESDSSLVAGVVSEEDGTFQLNGNAQNTYYLEIRFMGFQTYRQGGIKVEGRNRTVDVGKIALISGDEILEGIEVRGDRQQSLHSIDKQVYKADQFQAAMGGTAVDILRNMPAISVNAEGDILMRGTGGFLVLLDGKPVQGNAMVLLNQLPANAIDDIEIITSPSAKYDPDGKSGIIHIKTKKGSTDGVYFIVNTRLGAPSIETFGNEKVARRYGTDFTFNLRKNKWDLSIGADYKRDDIAGYRDGEVETLRGDTLTSFPSLGERSYRRESYSGRIAATYTFNPKNAISASVFAGKRSELRTADILYDQTRTIVGNEAPFERFQYFNANLRERIGDFFIGSIDYNHVFDNKSTLSASALYERTILGGPTHNLNLNPLNFLDTLEYQVMDEYNPLDGFRFNLDYVLPLQNNARLEMGYQFRYLFHLGEFSYNEKVLGSPEFISRPQFGGNIDLQRTIHSLYTQYTGKTGKLDYSAGLRLEHTDRLLSEEDGTSYPLELLNLFPSVNLLYDLGNNYSLKAGYSRRIERTTTSMMNPFLARRHSEVLEEGDPELLPEFIDAIEVGIVKEYDQHSFFANAYYRRTLNVINRVNSVFNDSILYRTFTNAGVGQAYGIEAGTELKPTRWWKLFAGGTLYQYAVEGRLMGEFLSQNSLNYSVNLNTTFQLLPSLNMQFNLNYLSRTVTIQGEDSRFFMPNLSINKSILKDQGAITLQWMSMGMGWLNSNQQRITTSGSQFFTTTNYIKEVDMVLINFSYRINELSKKLKFSQSEFGDKEF
ncbi:MAG: TonB-dependent receptor [Cyclobacteriaceae bacterium]|nr:TonB-dependent receptor [Cyclobacteriaceae bacterium]